MGRPLLPLLFLAATALACGDDGATPGVRDECAHAGGTLLGCEPRPVETVQDACWKLVDCTGLPIESDGFDWGDCVDDISDMPPERESFVLECIDASTCDDLKAGLCFEYAEGF
jgi:hypothetical protein